MKIIKRWKVHGMTCASCERLIASEFRKLSEVEDVYVSLKKKKVTVILKDSVVAPSFDDALKELHGHGYTLNPIGEDGGAACEVAASPPTPLKKRLVRAALALGIVWAGMSVILLPFRQVIPSIGAQSSVFALFFYGVIASFSTCLASTGGFLLAYGAKTQVKRSGAVQLGRLTAFVAGGGALGLVGGSLPELTGGFYGIVALVLGIAFLIVGLHLFELSPSLSSYGIRMPKGAERLANRVLASRSRFAPCLVGAVTFVLPCGFTQSAQALALASGDPLQGALMLGAFALGTSPVLYGVAAFGSSVALKQNFVRLTAGAMLVMFSFSQIDGGLTVLGSPVTPGSFVASIRARVFSSGTTLSDVPSNLKEQVVRMIVQYGTYQPKNLVVRAGIPVRWEIDGKDIEGCVRDLVMPTYGIRKRLAPGTNIIAFTPKAAGTIPFSCGMGMIRGSFTVVN